MRLLRVLFLGCTLLLVGCNSSKTSNEIACGGSMNFACPADMYCNTKEDCGGIDGNGICAMRPTQCKSEVQPVCGCDGQTYSSACLAAAKGVSLKSLGECKTPVPQKVEENLPEEIEAEEGITGE